MHKVYYTFFTIIFAACPVFLVVWRKYPTKFFRILQRWWATVSVRKKTGMRIALCKAQIIRRLYRCGLLRLPARAHADRRLCRTEVRQVPNRTVTGGLRRGEKWLTEVRQMACGRPRARFPEKNGVGEAGGQPAGHKNAPAGLLEGRAGRSVELSVCVTKKRCGPHAGSYRFRISFRT